MLEAILRDGVERMAVMSWPRSELIAALAVAVAIVSALAQVLTISNTRLRRFLLLALGIAITIALRLVFVAASPHASEPTSPPGVDSSPKQPTPPPEPVTQAVPPKVESGQPPMQPPAQASPEPIVTIHQAVVPPAPSTQKAIEAQSAIVGRWASDAWYAADIQFTADGKFTSFESMGGVGGLPGFHPAGTYRFLSNDRIEIRLLTSDAEAEWELSISGDELRISIISGFGHGGTYHRRGGR